MRPKLYKPEINWIFCNSLWCPHVSVVSLFVFLSFLLQRFVKMAVSTEEGVWLPTDVCVPMASPGLSVREVMSATLAVLSISLAHLTSHCHYALLSLLTTAKVVFKATRAAFVKTWLNAEWRLFFVTENNSCLVMAPAPGMWFVVELLHVKLVHYFPHLLSNNALGNVMSF